MKKNEYKAILAMLFSVFILGSCTDNEIPDIDPEKQFEASLPTDTIDEIFYVSLNGIQYCETDYGHNNLTPENIEAETMGLRSFHLHGYHKMKAKVYKILSAQDNGIDVKTMWFSSIADRRVKNDEFFNLHDSPQVSPVDINKYSSTFRNDYCSLEIIGDEIIMTSSNNLPLNEDEKMFYMKVGLAGITTDNKLFTTYFVLNISSPYISNAPGELDAFKFEHPDTIVSADAHCFKMISELDREAVRNHWKFPIEIDYEKFGSIPELKYFTGIKEWDGSLPESWSPWYYVHFRNMGLYGFEYDYEASLTNFHSDWANLVLNTSSGNNLEVDVNLQPNNSGFTRKYNVRILGHAEMYRDKKNWLHEYGYFGHFTITQLSK